MSLSYSSHYGLVRIVDMDMSTKNWAVTDSNVELLSRLIYAAADHNHTGATPLPAPGYIDSTTWATPGLAYLATPGGGGIAAGSSVGFRFSYLDGRGLETEASPELAITVPVADSAPIPPSLSTPTATAGKIPGGQIVRYAMSKLNGVYESLPSVPTNQLKLPSKATGLTPAAWTVSLYFPSLRTFALGASTPFDGYGIYRQIGTGSYQLVKTLRFTADADTTTFKDTNVVENISKSVPLVSTLGRDTVVRLDLLATPTNQAYFAAKATPDGASTLNVYVTQDPGTWAATSLLTQIDLATPYNSLTYTGEEVLAPGYPLNISQQVASADQINLGTEAIGAPIYTTDADAKGFQTKRFVFPVNLTNAASTPGGVYYDFSTDSLKVYSRTLGSFLTFATPGGTYTHPEVSNGGHNASNIYYASPLTVASVLNSFASPVPKTTVTRRAAAYQVNFPADVTSITTAPLAPDTATASKYSGQTAVAMSTLTERALVSGSITPDYPGQIWQFTWSGTVADNSTVVPKSVFPITGSILCNLGLALNGTTLPGTTRKITLAGLHFASSTVRGSQAVTLSYTTPISGTVTSVGLVGSVGNAVYATPVASGSIQVGLSNQLFQAQSSF